MLFLMAAMLLLMTATLFLAALLFVAMLLATSVLLTSALLSSALLVLMLLLLVLAEFFGRAERLIALRAPILTGTRMLICHKFTFLSE